MTPWLLTLLLSFWNRKNKHYCLISSSPSVTILFLSFTCEDIGDVMVTNINSENISIIVFISPL